MTRSELEQAVYRRTQKNTSSVDTTTQTRIRHFLNRRYRRLIGDMGIGSARDVLSFSSVASQSRYALASVDRLLALRDTTNDAPIFPMGVSTYRALNADPSNSPSTPTHYVPFGWEAVAKQPSNASELFLDSTSASDTQTAYAEVDLTDGYPRTLSVSLTGTTAVSLSASVTSIIRVRKLYLASAAAGIVTLHEDADGGTELARIGIGQTKQKYFVLHLHPQPSAVITYEADVDTPITDLAQDTDEPRFPERFHDLLELGATMDELGKSKDDRLAYVITDYNNLYSDWIYWCAVQRQGSPMPAEFSSLGAWYPDGS